FIPIEYALFAAYSFDNDLYDYANSKKIALITASSIFPTLRIIEGLWRIEKAGKSTDEILKAAEELHRRVENFTAEMERVEKALKSGQEAFNAASIKLTGKQGIVKSAEKLEDLGIKYRKSLKDGSPQEDALLELPQETGE
ncbi:MAG: DNA recombination protein RmuC, partial [Elusimicrobiota bacterium]|nr:DNA recombination protein RmuC [Elusimicrobiota bacterium]